MPWHGKSSPPAGWHNEEYQLTSAQYTAMILEIMTALELDRPILIGCSIGGRIALHLALEHPEALPRHHRPAGRRPCRSLLRPELPAPARRPWRRSLRRHRLRAGRPRRARQGALGNAVALHAGRPRRVQGRSLFLQARRRHPRPRRADRHASAVRCSCCPANTTIPARRRKRWRSPTALRAARSPS